MFSPNIKKEKLGDERQQREINSFEHLANMNSQAAATKSNSNRSKFA